jgi:hypothetical protein
MGSESVKFYVFHAFCEGCHKDHASVAIVPADVSDEELAEKLGEVNGTALGTYDDPYEAHQAAAKYDGKLDDLPDRTTAELLARTVAGENYTAGDVHMALTVMRKGLVDVQIKTVQLTAEQGEAVAKALGQGGSPTDLAKALKSAGIADSFLPKPAKTKFGGRLSDLPSIGGNDDSDELAN